jgi:catechol 2,3-dioxygenase-like lactoylglutathione lyase family enzyme
MLSHTTLGVADVSAARRFYDPLLDALGLIPKFADEHRAGWRHPAAERPLFIICRPYDRGPPAAGNGQMIAFLACSQSLVRECYSVALQHGGTDEGRPALRPEYHADYYGAYFRDPDGNKLCVCCHQA